MLDTCAPHPSVDDVRVDKVKANAARVYDYLLGGTQNFAVDRAAGERMLRIIPDARQAPRSNRAFLRRVVRHLAGAAGIRQFLDIGSGLPTQGNVHEIAQAADPSTRVVYVDNDPVVLAHARSLIANDHTHLIRGDLREPWSIVDHPVVRRVIDFDRPLGLLLLSVLHHIDDADDPDRLVAGLRDAMPRDSYLAISHLRNPGPASPEDAELAALGQRIFHESYGAGRWRCTEEILGYFGDWEMLPPGLVPVPEWRPDPGDGNAGRSLTHYLLLGGVARKS